jgi:hypothetical protein
MNARVAFASLLLVALTAAPAARAAPATRLVLDGYTDPSGAITVLHEGDSTDPYFAIQALLLAHENGMNIADPAERFVHWLLPSQKPDGTFDRFCRGADRKWASCKTADADDSLLALWMKLLETMPAKLERNVQWRRSHEISSVALERLFQPSRGVYMVSPVVLHGLFMDNLEVWSLKAHSKQSGNRAGPDKLAKAIHATFWEPVNQHFLVSTQLEQRSQKRAFYPDHVAQIFPLLVDFPLLPAAARAYYKSWMSAHRAEWLAQGVTDYSWGLIAVLALRQDDRRSASCWMRQATPLRHSARWAVTDETALQILLARGVAAAPASARCL